MKNERAQTASNMASGLNTGGRQTPSKHRGSPMLTKKTLLIWCVVLHVIFLKATAGPT